KENPDYVFDIKTLSQFIPSNIKVKNVNFVYSNNLIKSNLAIKDIAIVNSSSDSINISLYSQLQASLLQAKQKLSCLLNVTGTLYSNLDNSNLTLKFLDFTNGNVTLNKLCLMAKYNQGTFSLNTIQTVNPVYISASYDIENKSCNAQVTMEELKAFSLISVDSHQKELDKLKNLSIKTDTQLSCSLEDIKNPKVNFKSKGSFFIPQEIFDGTLAIEYDLSGNEKELDIKSLDLNGQKCSADLELSLIYKNLLLSGFAQIPYIILPNGKTISTEFYFDPLDKGFLLFSPQIFIGDKVLTALQTSVIPEEDSCDFMLEVYDYSHVDQGNPGLIKFDGSYLLSSNYIQTNTSLNSIYLDSLLDFVLEAVDKKIADSLQGLKAGLKNFIFSADAYFSTDFQSLSYSIPYVVIANTSKDNQFLMLTANGNEQSIQLNQLSLIYGKYALEAAATLDIDPSSSDMFYTVDLLLSSIPYHFSGNIMKEVITFSGDYGTQAQVNLSPDKFDGFAIVENLPFTLTNQSYIFSLNSKFAYDKENGPSVNVNRISLENVSSNYTISPKVMATGNVNKYGAQIDSITYTDYYSTLEGSADVMLNINEGMFDSASLILNVESPSSDESISMDASLSNPEHIKLSGDSILSSLYLSSQVQLNDFSLNRFAKSSHENNTLTASLFATGTLDNPYIALTIEKLSMLLAATFWEVSGIATLEDNGINIQDFNVSCPGLEFKNINADFSLESYTGKGDAEFSMGDSLYNINIPLSVKISDTYLAENSFMPESFSLTASAHDVSGTLVKKPFELTLGAIYANNAFNFYSDDKIGVYGTFSTKGELDITSVNKMASLQVIGKMDKYQSEINIKNLNVKLPELCSYLNIDDFALVKEGVLEGNLTLSGDMDDPDLKGAMKITSPRVNVPMVFKNDITTDSILITAINNEIQLVDNNYMLGNVNKINASGKVFFNKWLLEHVELSAKSYQKEYIPFDMDLGFLKFIGDVMCDLDLLFQADSNYLDLEGKFYAENVTISSALTDLGQAFPANQEMAGNPPAVRTKLDIGLGTHVSLNFDPILRCVFVPNTKVLLNIDSDSNTYEVDGSLNLKSGDVAYLNRNFYIKEGSIKFNPADISNPLVTLRAETRERDQDGENVKIILSADNQYLKDLKPRFYSEPAKSEMEIQNLLGQIITADSSGATSFIAAASDYAFQSMVFRKTENKLRDLFNFDIFSLRTNVLQNSLDLYSNNFQNQRVGIGNLFDNSTVYIGKYLGSSLYVDAMLQVSFEDNINNIAKPGSLLFQPDFGLELESPFGNIRWNLAPDINALMHNQFVPSTSVSVSWKFSF
ncbi:MAG: translocation/assembly module TamB, partial [Treponema sp.]|nr:translocation/assembly module TamB [Treponema sp.]